MRTRNRTNEITESARLLDTPELQVYTGLGRNTAMRLGEEAGAKVTVGKRVLWDKVRLDQHISELTGA